MHHIIEIQTMENGASVIVPNAQGQIPQTEDLKEARAQWHEKMMYAQRSGLPVHTVLVINERGERDKWDYVLANGDTRKDAE